ncbi:PREDICTED: uncharacterized protein LOC109209391 [Nicotiana attenuata]|uniref:uncharacterized protein LOC109209391 n=1 Tax=Nicotiana attenuata TaxID=49451 RepID=UPI0009048284|nr:PREDICTED: uncharacterized protein LOC109209391 [Nicotiana attenuata]
MRRSRSTNSLLPLDLETERTLQRVRRKVEARTRIERELDIIVQPHPIEMAVNEERPVIKAARPNLTNMTQAITKSLRSQILGFQQRDGETLRQAWERYKKLLRDCPHHYQIDEVLVHTFVDGLDEVLGHTFVDGKDGESRRAIKQKAVGVIELDDFSAMRADIAKLANQMNRMTMHQTQQMQHKRKDKPIPEGEYIPKATHESKKVDASSEPVNVARPPPPFPKRLQKKNDDRMFNKFLAMLSQVKLNIPLVDVLREIPKYAKYIKDIVAYKRRLTEFETVALTEECTSRVQNKLPQKLKDPGNFTNLVRIGNIDMGRALCDLGASINLMPLSLFKQLGLGAPRPTTVMLQLADRSIAYPEGVIEDVLLQIGKFIFPADFIILDYEAVKQVPIILGRPLLAIGDAIIKVTKGKMIMRVETRKKSLVSTRKSNFPAIMRSSL